MSKTQSYAGASLYSHATLEELMDYQEATYGATRKGVKHEDVVEETLLRIANALEVANWINMQWDEDESDGGQCPESWKFYFPVLAVLGDRKERDANTIHADVAKHMKLSRAAKSEKTGKGNALKYHNRANWAAAHMRKLGWIESVRWGVMRITAEGKQVLKEHRKGFTHEEVSQIMYEARI